MSLSKSNFGHLTTRIASPFALAAVLVVGLPGVPPPGSIAPNLPAIERGDTTASLASLWHPSARAADTSAAQKVRYTCPMHPHYIADHPGPCPICGMDLVAMASSDTNGAATSEDREAISIAPETLQNMGVRIAPAERANFGRTVRATAMVMENERSRSILTGRVEGWIEDLAITAVGDPVKKGMKLFELYAPELVVSQRDYLMARKERDGARQANTMARLRSFGVQPEVMQQLTDDGREMQRVPFFADRDGVVAELPVANGEYIKRGATILRIQDYTSVWLVVNVAEKDLALIAAKTPARVSFPNLPKRTFDTKIDYIYPTIDARTRTGRVRLVVDNRDGSVRPGSFADVTFDVDAESRLAVASEAILRNEAGAHVVLALGDGRFQPRRVETGLSSGRWTEIRKGLEGGEQIVVSGQFLIDSESALRESFRKLERLQMPLPLLAPSSVEMAMIDHIVDAALYIHEATVDGYPVNPKFLDPARDIKNLLWPKFGKTQLSFVLEDATAAIVKAQAARSESEMLAALGALVGAIRPWIVEGAPQHYTERNVSLFKDKPSGAMWIQTSAKPFNPYGRGESELIAPAGEAAAQAKPPGNPATKAKPPAAPSPTAPASPQPSLGKVDDKARG